MKKYISLLVLSVILMSCKTEMDQAMKSADKDFILKVANEKFTKKKWADALALYDRLPNLVAGTDDAPNVVFNSAYANYYDKNYRLAANQFKNFVISFPQDPRKEEAAYLSALCYYEGSLQYNLDQSNTESAITELQNFLNEYPDSERSKNITQLVDELTYKLEFKAFENAKQYFRMGEFKAAAVTFENVLEDFPATKLRPKIYDIILKSKYELAVNSIYDLKKERLDAAASYAKRVSAELPNSEYSKTADDLYTKLEDEKVKFAQLQVEVEKRKAEYEAKVKNAEAKENEKKELEQEKNQAKLENVAEQTRRDSAKINSPEPQATFKFKR
ncbi:outer membrane protein assembly factor BamD [Epilithonimonas xixisoli]|uniref:Beta-barrel assembly machine subunit BamD n=1 Tax=Epilithonimonas xixisoli TaxID=1476462 RepID=A0A4R8IG28_9FLAO|nr:outer membrane protein assembly factor BamD [Epilithonimonas xixisoli]TDX84414.1 Beta-barrel assembly machine subunit BamD [Epilithonimonas xixisoli]